MENAAITKFVHLIVLDQTVKMNVHATQTIRNYAIQLLVPAIVVLVIREQAVILHVRHRIMVKIARKNASVT